MQTQKTLLITILAASFGGLTGVAFADVQCPPNPGATSIDDNVIVTGRCTLNGTKVKGNVLVKSGGALTVRDASIDRKSTRLNSSH